MMAGDGMYSSLDRIDFIATAKDGSSHYVQTDHRGRAEIEQDRPMSTVFAIMRVVNASRTAAERGGQYKVIYNINEEPPQFLQQAIACAGGVVEAANKELIYQGQLIPCENIVESCLAEIAAGISQAWRLDYSVEGLQALEQGLAQQTPAPETDEITYWSQVVRAGAFAGEVMRKMHGGRWDRAERGIGTLPFVFVSCGVMFNFLGKAIKLFANGPEDSIASMVRAGCAVINDQNKKKKSFWK